MKKKSKGYIWLRQSFLGKGTYVKKYWVGQRVGKIYPLLGFREKKDFINSVRVNEKDMNAFTVFRKLKQGDRIDITKLPEGGRTGNMVLGAIMIGIGVFAIATPFGVGLIIAGGLTFATALLTKAPKPRSQVANDPVEKRYETVGAKNEISKSIIPVLLGKTQVTAFYGQYATRWTGDGTATNVYQQYFVPCYNNVEITSEKLGETSLTEFGSKISVQKAYGSSTALFFENIYPKTRNEQLTIDEEDTVDDVVESISTYSGSTDIVFVLTYSKLTDISDFTDKQIKVSGSESGESVVVTVTSDDLVVGVDTYTYTSPTITLDLSGETIVFTNNVTTRQSSAELTEELDCTFTSLNGTVYNLALNSFDFVPNYVIDSTPADTIGIEWIFKFPQGLFYQNPSGGRSPRALYVKCRWKEKDTGTYYDLEDADNIYVRDKDGNKKYGLGSSSTTTYDPITKLITFRSPDNGSNIAEMFYRNIGIDLPKGQYTFEVSYQGFVGGKGDNDFGSVYLDDTHAVIEGNPVLETVLPKVTQIKFTAQAYMKLSGILEQYNFIGESIVNIWDGSNWDTIAASSNPAAVIRFSLLSRLYTPRPMEESQLDNDSFVEFYNYCEKEGFKVGAFITDEKKMHSVIEEILANCRSCLMYTEEGKLGIATDKAKEVSNLLTPHNTLDVKFKYGIGEKPNALRLTYVSDEEYKQQEKTYYYYNKAVWEVPEGTKTIDDYKVIKQAVKYTVKEDNVDKIAAYTLKTTHEKLKEGTCKVNLESLSLGIFDRVLVSNTTGVGQQYSGRVESVTRNVDGDVTSLRLESYIELDNPKNGEYFKMYVRSMSPTSVDTADLEVSSFDIAEKNGRYRDLNLLSPYDDGGIIRGKEAETIIEEEGVYGGDLFDINDAQILDCIVTSIDPEPDLTASISLLETPQEFYVNEYPLYFNSDRAQFNSDDATILETMQQF